MISFANLARELKRPQVLVLGLQNRFGLPVLPLYSEAYLRCLQVIVFLRILGIPEAELRDLWELEKKLVGLLRLNTTGSTTWYLDSCCAVDHRERRLFLTNFDLGVPLPSQGIQLGLDFSGSLPELFSGTEMGEDALRLLGDCLRRTERIHEAVKGEAPVVREALAWAQRLKS